jgi:hypothetical protein
MRWLNGCPASIADSHARLKTAAREYEHDKMTLWVYHCVKVVEKVGKMFGSCIEMHRPIE